MDISKQYILMCEKGKEIQKDWKPSLNDFCYIKNEDCIKSVNDCADGEYSQSTESIRYYEAKKIGFWLPRQDQLQGMVDIRPGEFNNWHPGYVDFIIWYGKTVIHDICSMEQLWLAFVMNEKFNKVWNGKDWINDN